MRGVNDHEAAALLRWALDEGLSLRFIEQMPLDPQHGWNRAMMVTREEILDSLERAGFHLAPLPGRGSAPGRGVRDRRRPGDGGHRRLGDQPVLRRLRPRPADRRRALALLPVRPARGRPAHAAARRLPTTSSSPPRCSARSRSSSAGTASTSRRSPSPTGRCRRSAAERCPASDAPTPGPPGRSAPPPVRPPGRPGRRHLPDVRRRPRRRREPARSTSRRARPPRSWPRWPPACRRGSPTCWPPARWSPTAYRLDHTSPAPIAGGTTVDVLPPFAGG